MERLGKEAGEKILVPLLFVTEDPEEIPFDDLPEEYIIKPNHGSGWSIIVDRDHKVPRKKIISKCRKWMKKTYGQSKMEWAYSQVRPMIMVEELLKDSNGVLPTDFKFEVFSGKVANVYLSGHLPKPITTEISGGARALTIMLRLRKQQSRKSSKRWSQLRKSLPPRLIASGSIFTT